MTGTGIQEDPYVVGSWEEFEQAASIGTHIKLGNDIYAPDTATNLDMNNVDSLDGDDHACLLYTSPSPRDPKTSRMPSSA